MSQLHTAQEARQQHRSKDTKQRSQRQQRRQAAAASRDKAERRGSNVPRCAPSQAVLARKLTPLQRRPATRHLQEKKKNTAITCLKAITSLQTKIFNNVGIKLHAWISNTPTHATFA